MNDVLLDKTNRVSTKLKAIYKDNILPAEKRYQYDYFYESPFLTDVEFDAKPQVMLVGQYSVGKTSFIRYMLGKDFPGARIGPEPTTGTLFHAGGGGGFVVCWHLYCWC